MTTTISDDDRAAIAGAVALLGHGAEELGSAVYAETAQKLWNILYPGMETGEYPSDHPLGKSRVSAGQAND